MKRYAIVTMALALGCMMLVGCGCMNTGSDVTTLPTNGETAAPTTRATTAPTTEATTMPTTMPETQATGDTGMDSTTDTTGTLEGAMDDITGQMTEESTGANDMGRGRQRGMMPKGQ